MSDAMNYHHAVIVVSIDSDALANCFANLGSDPNDPFLDSGWKDNSRKTRIKPLQPEN
jgi:hypothetical protein